MARRYSHSQSSPKAAHPAHRGAIPHSLAGRVPQGLIGSYCSLPGRLSHRIRGLIFSDIHSYFVERRRLWVMWLHRKLRTVGIKMALSVYTLHMWMDGQCKRSRCCFTGSTLSASVAAPLLGQKRKTFLTGQRANAPLPAIQDDGIGGAWREGKPGWGHEREGRYLDMWHSCNHVPVFHSSPPILPSSLFFLLLEKLAEPSCRVQVVWVSSYCLLLHLDLQAASVILTGPPGAVQSLVSCCGWRWFTGGPCVCFPFPCCWFC